MKIRISTLLATAIMALAVSSQGQYPKYGVQLKKNIPLNEIPGNPSSGAGVTGFLSASGREYGVMGVRNGTIIVEVTNPASPVVLSRIPSTSSLWHENVVLGNYGYFVTDQNGNGMQIVDLSQVDSGTATLVSTYTGNGLATVHTIQANPVSKTLYLNGSNRGLVFLDATNPTAPVEVGRWQGKYVHDCFPITFTSGPYAGREIVFACCGSEGLYILDVTNKASVQVLGNNKYIQSGGYCHSGTLTPDGKYFIVNDELDEMNSVVNTCTSYVFDVQNLSAPVRVGHFSNPINVIDHNSRWRDGFLILAAYRAGIRIYDASNPLSMSEVGYFDSYPSGSGFEFDGAWGTYIFPSGNAIIGDMDRGLFVVDITESINMGAPFTGAQTLRGTVVSGGTNNLRKSDDSYMVLQGSTTITSKIRGVIETFSLETTRLPASFVDVTLEGKIDNIAFADVVVSAKDWTTGQWTQVALWRLTSTESTQTVTNLASSNYVDADGKIELKLESYNSGRSTVPLFNTYLDVLKANVHN